MKTRPIALAAAGLVLLLATGADAGTLYRRWAHGKPPPGQGWFEGTALAGSEAAAKQAALKACKAKHMSHCVIDHCMRFPG